MFWTETLSAFQTMTPLSPSAEPPTTGPKFCAEGLRAHAGEPGLVPSTITVLRFIPRRWRLALVISTPAGRFVTPAGSWPAVVL